MYHGIGVIIEWFCAQNSTDFHQTLHRKSIIKKIESLGPSWFKLSKPHFIILKRFKKQFKTQTPGGASDEVGYKAKRTSCMKTRLVNILSTVNALI